MTMDILCRVTATGLVPMYDSDYDEKQRLSEGDTVLCTIRKPRNYEFHKKFFALVRLTFDNLPERLVRMLNIHSEESMLDNIKLDLGLYTIVWHARRPVLKLGSISFAKMDETAFQQFYNRCIDIILTNYLRGTTRQEIIEEVERFK